MGRKAEVQRKTTETDITLAVDLDGTGEHGIDTGIPFLDHMLALFAKHGLFDLQVAAKGDLEVDFHHTVEDVGLCLGEAIRNAAADKRGIRRFGFASVPMMESLATITLDLCGRPYLVFVGDLPAERAGEFDADLIEEFIRALSNEAGLTVHVQIVRGRNLHHSAEAIFKALGRALDEATSIDPRSGQIPSTKGSL